MCAGEQGRLWPYHDLLFDNQSALDGEDLIAYAREAGLDEAAFRECVDGRRFADRLDRDIADGEAAGVSGTPAFFVNGRFLSGAQSYEVFRDLIESEMGRRG